MTHLPHLRTIALLALITATIGAQTQKAPPPTDWQIEAQVQQALAKDSAFKGSSIISGVNKGVVTLTGNVRSETEKALASQDLANIEGVKTVLNNLTIVDNRFHAPAPSGPTGPTGTLQTVLS